MGENTLGCPTSKNTSLRVKTLQEKQNKPLYVGSLLFLFYSLTLFIQLVVWTFFTDIVYFECGSKL
jgi:hypothetical protein